METLDRESYTPRDVYKALDERVAGNEQAKKKISLIIWNMFHGRRSVSFLIGPTGCGKTEIIRTLEDNFLNYVRIVDANILNAEGWSSALHLSDVLSDMAEDLREDPALLVIDEFDKKVLPAVGSKGTDYNRMLQHDFLKICDGDTIELKKGDETLFIDCSRLSVIFVGAFTDIRKQKNTVRHPLGFGVQQEDEEPDKEITVNDLIKYGLAPELAGRINRIIQLDTPDNEMMLKIADMTLQNICNEMDISLRFSDELLKQLASHALESGLGARQMRTDILDILDDVLFECPEAKLCDLDAHTAETDCSYSDDDCCDDYEDYYCDDEIAEEDECTPEAA